MFVYKIDKIYFQFFIYDGLYKNKKVHN